jgi:hypothetical protein
VLIRRHVQEYKNDWNCTYEMTSADKPGVKTFVRVFEIDQECLRKGIFDRVDMPADLKLDYDSAVGFACDPLIGSLVVALNMREGCHTLNSCNGSHQKQLTDCLTPSPVVEFACNDARARAQVLTIVGEAHFGTAGRDGQGAGGAVGGSCRPVSIHFSAAGSAAAPSVAPSAGGGAASAASSALIGAGGGDRAGARAGGSGAGSAVSSGAAGAGGRGDGGSGSAKGEGGCYRAIVRSVHGGTGGDRRSKIAAVLRLAGLLAPVPAGALDFLLA